jgi:hypothetical protein
MVSVYQSTLKNYSQTVKMYSGHLYLNRPGQVLEINQFKMIRIQRHIYKSYRISEKGGGGSNI